MGTAPRVGQPAPLVRGPWPVVLEDGLLGRVIDFRPERAALQAEHAATFVDALRRPDAVAETGRPDAAPVAVTAVWVERLDQRVPSGARELGTRARREGWRVRYSFATGYGVDSLCVWLARGRDRARMCYRDGRADRAVVWGPERMITTMTVTQLGAWMDGADS